MAGIDNIIRRIEEDAGARAEEILQQAHEEARAIQDKAYEQAQKVRDDILKKAETDAAEAKRRMRMAAQLQMRKDILSAKQEMIERAFEEALQRLEVMDAEQYRQYIRHWILSADIDGDEEIIISEKDMERITPDFIETINQELKARGKAGTMFLSPEHRSMRGGFILRKGGIEANNSIEALMHAYREELEPEIAGVLFGEVN